MAVRVLLADDHQIVRQGLRALLERGGAAVIGEAADGQQAVALAEELNPEIAVVDLSMPVLNGLDAARAMARRAPRTRVIMLTMYTDRQYVVQAMRVGVRGFVVKTQAAEELQLAMRDVLHGSVYLSPGVASTMVDAFLDGPEVTTDPLTPRERQVLQLIAEGKSTKEAARVLDISYKTAESHRTRMMRKLGIHQTAGLVRYAIRRGLTQA